MEYEGYYKLWHAIAQEFGCSGACLPGKPYPCVKRIRSNPGELEIPGELIFYHPWRQGNTPGGPPVLLFRPNALSHVEMVLGSPAIHYEWVLKHGTNGVPGKLDAALHFHFDAIADNAALFQKVPRPPTICVQGRNLTEKYYTFPESRFYREGWTCYRYRWECDSETILDDASPVAAPAATAMEYLIGYTWEQLLRGWGKSDG